MINSIYCSFQNAAIEPPLIYYPFLEPSHSFAVCVPPVDKARIYEVPCELHATWKPLDWAMPSQNEPDFLPRVVPLHVAYLRWLL
jgi:hypothetical protein